MINQEVCRIISGSSAERGGICIPEGFSVIIAKWKITIWRIFVDSSGDSNSAAPVTEKKIELHILKLLYRQQATIDRIVSNDFIEYCKTENRETIRSLCLDKNEKYNSLQKRI